MKETRKIKAEPKMIKPKILNIVPLFIFNLKNGNLIIDFRLAIYLILLTTKE